MHEIKKQKHLKRYGDWPERLNAFLDQEHKFVWGESDCCLFAADAVLRITGTDLAAKYRDKYKSEAGAARMLRKADGLGNICSKAADQFDLEEVPVLFARRGDMVIFETELGGTLGVVSMDGTMIASIGLSGSVSVPVSMGLRAWRI